MADGGEDEFELPSRNGRCQLGEASFAGVGGEEEDAPLPAVPCGGGQGVKSTQISYPRSSDRARLEGDENAVRMIGAIRRGRRVSGRCGRRGGFRRDPQRVGPW
jgi:hypothetical protein